MKWKDDGCKKPYMLIGARQVGKTYILQEFCKNNFRQYLYINLERDQEIKKIFEESIDPEVIIRQIGFLEDHPIDINETVISIG